MAVKPVDRIRTMITELERGARTLGDDIRKRAGNVAASDLEAALRQLMQGLTTIAAQLEKAAGELRRYLEKGAKAGKAKGGRKGAAKSAAKKGAKKSTKKKAAAKAPAKKAAKAPAKKAAAKKAR